MGNRPPKLGPDPLTKVREARQAAEKATKAARGVTRQSRNSSNAVRKRPLLGGSSKQHRDRKGRFA